MLLAAGFNSFSFSHVFIKRGCERCNHHYMLNSCSTIILVVCMAANEK